jgi:hypothetical protein
MSQFFLSGRTHNRNVGRWSGNLLFIWSNMSSTLFRAGARFIPGFSSITASSRLISCKSMWLISKYSFQKGARLDVEQWTHHSLSISTLDEALNKIPDITACRKINSNPSVYPASLNEPLGTKLTMLVATECNHQNYSNRVEMKTCAH